MPGSKTPVARHPGSLLLLHFFATPKEYDILSFAKKLEPSRRARSAATMLGDLPVKRRHPASAAD
jgi:hypothetical protein